MVSLKDDKVRKNVPACAPEQATIKLWKTGAGKGQSSVLLSFATCAGGAEGSPATWFGWQPDPSGAAPLPTTSAVTEVALGVAPGAYTHGGCSSTAVTSYSENWAPSTGSGPQGGGSYTSPILHHCLLKNLTAGVKCVFIFPHFFSSFFSPLIFFAAPVSFPFSLKLFSYPSLCATLTKTHTKNRYYYKIADAPQLPGTTATGENPYFGSFQVPRPAFPLRIGIAGDPGQLINSTLTIDILVAQKPDVLLMTGDMAYADSGTSNVRG